MISAVQTPLQTASGRTRGIYHLPEKIDTQWAWFAVDSTGYETSLYRAREDDGETDAMIVAKLAREQRQRDPVRHLELVRPSVPWSLVGVLAARTAMLRPRRARPVLPPSQSAPG